jgi:hypothetical protein
MPGRVEEYHAIAVSSESQAHGLHHLLIAAEAVGDDDSAVIGRRNELQGRSEAFVVDPVDARIGAVELRQ